MVRVRVDRRYPVDASREAASNRRTQDSVHRRRVQALEERKLGWVRDSGVRERGNLLDRNVGVRDDETLAVELLRGRVVVGLRVDEVARLQVLHGQLDGERLVGCDRSQISRGDKLGACDASK